jgi:hypothetical protein
MLPQLLELDLQVCRLISDVLQVDNMGNTEDTTHFKRNRVFDGSYPA